MKLLNLYNRKVSISYKHSICSFPALFVGVCITITISAPLFIVFGINNDLWSTKNAHKIIFEQPSVKFPYKYVFTAQHTTVEKSPITTDNDEYQLVSFSSYDYFNQIMEKWYNNGIIMHWFTDYDHNKIIDQMTFKFEYELPNIIDRNSMVKQINSFIELDVNLLQHHHCPLNIPAAILIEQTIPIEIQQLQMQDQNIGFLLELNGRLKFEQKSSFYCPFFLRDHKTIFNKNLIPTNSTKFDDYEFSTINAKLRKNVGHFYFEKLDFQWNLQPKLATITIIINLDIDEVQTRYLTSFWQRSFIIWMEYLAILIIFIFGVDRLFEYLFGRQVLRAWESVPWKKLY